MKTEIKGEGQGWDAAVGLWLMQGCRTAAMGVAGG